MYRKPKSHMFNQISIDLVMQPDYMLLDFRASSLKLYSSSYIPILKRKLPVESNESSTRYLLLQAFTIKYLDPALLQKKRGIFYFLFEFKKVQKGTQMPVLTTPMAIGGSRFNAKEQSKCKSEDRFRRISGAFLASFYLL